MIYLIGANGFLGLKIGKIIPKKNIINISTSKKKNFINTKIFSKYNYINEKWINEINADDLVILLNNIGSIEYYQKNFSEVKEFEKKLFNNFLNKINKKTKIIFFSSDMVYSGKNNTFKESSKPKPINNYGKSKLRIENKLVKKFSNHLILRLSKIYSTNPKDKNFYTNTLKYIKSKKKVELFTDQKVHFLDVEYFVNIFKKIIQNIDNLNGVYNFPGQIFCSRYTFFLNNLENKKLKKFLVPIKAKNKYNFLPLHLKMTSKLFKSKKYFL
tara:strand:+ start:45 stop:857 length:813 start_codon:yes stop_codon:yes gene_type:complete